MAELRRAFEAHGLLIASTIDLTELKGSNACRAPDVEINEGPVTTDLPHATELGEGLRVTENSVLISVEGIARYLVEGKTRITVDRESRAPRHLVRLFLYGAALSGLLQQRGAMPLHASCVSKANRAIGFVGPSGQGKSTLAALMVNRGYRLLSDDKLVVKSRGDRALAFPGPPLMSLHPAAAQASGREQQERASSLKRFGKHSYLSNQVADHPACLACLILPVWGRKDEPVQVEKLGGFDSMLELRQNLNFGEIVNPLGLESQFVDWAKALIATVGIYRLRQPRSFDAVEETLSAVEAIASAGS